MLKIRRANKKDALLYYEWANEEAVRKQSFSTAIISLDDHIEWFEKKIIDPECIMLIFENELGLPAGQIRLQKEDEETYMIGISVDILSRGKGLATNMFKMASDYLFSLFPQKKIVALIKEDNYPSIKSLENAGYTHPLNIIFRGIKCIEYTKENTNANSGF